MSNNPFPSEKKLSPAACLWGCLAFCGFVWVAVYETIHMLIWMFRR